MYYVISGRLYAKDVMRMTTRAAAHVQTVQGQAAILKTQGVHSKHVYIDAAKVVIPDVKTTNGVIHVIDQVNIPEM